MRDPTPGLTVPTRHRVVRATELPERQGVVAFFSSQTRDGPWRVATGTRVVSTLASILLDLREAELSEEETVIEIFCLLGSVEVIVPPGVRVLNEGDALGGNFSMKAGDWDATAGTPVVRITGSVYLGDVEIRQQAFGETARDARKRLRKLRRG